MIYVLFLVVLVLLGLSIYANVISIRKMEAYERQIEVGNAFDERLLGELQRVLVTIKEIDEKGAFQADDEVGDIFDTIKTAILSLEVVIGDNK
jgi:hypothetical protein